MDQKSKSQEKREAVMGHASPSVEAQAKAQPTHRYFCDACTGVAFLHVEGQTLPNKAKCKACGKLITDIREQNLIKL